MLILIIVLMGLTALAVSVSPRPASRDSNRATAPEPAPPAAGRAGSDSAADRRPDSAFSDDLEGDPAVTTLSADKRDQVVKASVGQPVRIRVRSDALDTVQIGVDGPIKAVDPAAPAEFELFPDTPGDQDIVLLDSERTTIGTLEVTG